MNNLNSVLLEGNLTRDPELRYTPTGTAVCNFAIACNRYYKQEEEMQQEVSYFEITTWTRLAEVCGEYLKKGRGVRVVGRLKQDRWSDPEGQNRSKVFIVAEHVEFKPERKKSEDTVEGATAEEGVTAETAVAAEGATAEAAVAEEDEEKQASSF